MAERCSLAISIDPRNQAESKGHHWLRLHEPTDGIRFGKWISVERVQFVPIVKFWNSDSRRRLMSAIWRQRLPVKEGKEVAAQARDALNSVSMLVYCCWLMECR